MLFCRQAFIRLTNPIIPTERRFPAIYTLIIAEKPSVAQAIAAVAGAREHRYITLHNHLAQ